MINFVYSICQDDEFPYLETLTAQSYQAGVDKLIQKFIDKYDDDDKITDIDDFYDLQVYLNDKYNVVISDLYDIEDL